MEEKNNKKIKIIVAVIILFILCLGGYLAYIFLYNNNEETSVSLTKLEKYEKDENINVEYYYFNKETVSLDITERNFIDNGCYSPCDEVVSTTYLNKKFIIAIAGNPSDKYKKYKNGGADIWFSIEKDGSLKTTFYGLTDSNNNSYFDQVSDKDFTVKIKDEKFIQFAKDDYKIYLLTDKGNLYVASMATITETVSFERDLDDLKNKRFTDSIKNKNIEKIMFYYEDLNSERVGQLYAQLKDKSLIDVASKKKIEEAEKYATFYRFGNAGLIVTREGYLRYCNDWQGKSYCTEEKMGKIINDENNNPILVSFLFTTDKSELFVVDTSGNIYREEFVNTDHHVIEKLKKHNNKIASNYYYVVKNNETYMLKDFIIRYEDNSEEYFGSMSRITMYSKPHIYGNKINLIEPATPTTEDSNVPDESSTIEIHDSYERELINKLLDKCTITSIDGATIELRNPKMIQNDEYDTVVESDLYINGKFSRKLSYNWENTCDMLNIEEINDNYFLIRIVRESTYVEFYLFNKNGKFISDFSEWKKKYDSIWVGINNKGDFTVEHHNGFMEAMDESYCELKAKPSDICRTIEYLSIENDVIKVKNIKQTTWEEEFNTCADGYSCRNINDIDCSNIG